MESNARFASCRLGLALFALIAGLGMAAARPCRADGTRPLVIKAGRILTVTKGTIDNGVLVIRDGKITAIGKQGEVPLPADAEVLDASQEWVMPGQIDLHTHIGNDSGLHDYVHSINPEFRVWDYIDPDDPDIQDDIASGITTIMTIPGSGGNNSGFGVLWKLGGGARDELIIRKLGSMKIAQAYNPERYAGDLGLSRMGMWWMLRDLFARAEKYTAAWDNYEQNKQETTRLDGTVRLASADATLPHITASTGKKVLRPPYRLDMENIKTVIERQTPVFVHTAGARDVMETMRMFHDELHLPVIISHGEFGGFHAAEEAAKRNIPVNIGPRIFDFSSLIYDRKFYSLPTEYTKAGVQNISLNTDCPVLPGNDLFIQGTISVRLGLDEDAALRALTINPATAIGIADRVGSLEVGKDADLVLKRGSLFDPRIPIDRVLINGKTVYRHGQHRHGSPHGYSAARSGADGDGDEQDQVGESFLIPPQ